LMLQKDQALLDGTQSYDDISIDDVSLPTEAEIQAEQALISTTSKPGQITMS
ncbi:hypothetical protein VP01_7983g1, partial [Puccinia sorghi]